MTISQALIMAAGNATRMRPLTDNLPKPLLKIGDKPLLTHIIDHLIAEDVTHIIVNGYHAIEPLKEYMDDIRRTYPQCDFILSEETNLLETGGGAVQALQYLNPDEPFYMINGDAFWVNPSHSTTLNDLATEWSKGDYNCLLLLQKSDELGDYNIQNTMAARAKDKNGTYAFAGVRICTPEIIKPYALEKFSFLEIMDDCEKNNRLGGYVHQGQWYHISTPQDLDNVNNELFGDTE